MAAPVSRCSGQVGFLCLVWGFLLRMSLSSLQVKSFFYFYFCRVHCGGVAVISVPGCVGGGGAEGQKMGEPGNQVPRK